SFNGDRYVVDSIDFNDVNFVNVSAHELTHQWFGDLVTGKSSDDHWLHEAFATYYARLIDASLFGKAYNDYNVYQYDRQIIKNQNTDTIPLHRPNASSLTYYQKGARIVQMLRQKIGDSVYRKLIKTYLTKYRFGNASTSDFKQLLYDIKKDSLPAFFNLWFESSTIPKFVIKQKADSLIFDRNTHQLPIDFQLIYPDKKLIITKSRSFKLPDYKQLKTVIVNPDNQKLYDIHFERNSLWIKNQILSAPNFIDRFIALKDIRHWPGAEKDPIYNELINRNDYYPIYKEILSQIKLNLNGTHLNFIKKLFEKDLKTRQQIAVQLDKIPLTLKQEYKTLLNDASYRTKQAVLWHYWAQFPKEQSGLLNQTQEINGGNDKAFRLTWLSLALITPGYNQNKKTQYLNELINYASPDYNMLFRLNTFELLINLQIITPQVIKYLLDAGLHFNWRLHQPARGYLKHLYQTPAYQKMINDALSSLPEKSQAFYKSFLNH
ncbi:MAG TPA: hypothetical protein ENK75_03430, partial [Saprospiraceae bacterium]|nr:hypothetical protein [Saprospiraceae bacterium]